MFWFAVAFVISGTTLISNIMLPFKNKTKDMINDSLANSANVVIAKVDGYIDREFSVIEALANLPQIKDSQVSMEDKCRLLGTMAQVNPEYISIGFYDANGHTLLPDGSILDDHTSEFFQFAIKGQKYVLRPVFSEVTGVLTTFFAVPVRSENQKIIGAVVSIVNAEYLANVVTHVVIGEASHPYLFSYADGTIISHADTQKVLNGETITASVSPEYDALMKRVSNGGTAVETIKDPADGINKLVFYSPVGAGTDWGIVCMCPEHDFNGFLDVVRLRGRQYLISNMAFWLLIMAFIIVRNLKKLNVVTKALEEVASGEADLTKRLVVKSKDEVGDIVNSFNSFIDKLHEIIKDIKESETALNGAGQILGTSTNDTSSAITQILANIESVHGQIRNQNGSVIQTSTAVNEIAANIGSLGKMIEVQGSGVSNASAAVEEMIGNIGSVNHSVELMADSFNKLLIETQNGALKQEDVNERIKQIESQSEMLQEANEAIAAIASQTNLLAMNAAIEAAHAGESGKGFSVVADEIRKLSETSTAQSQTIGDQLANIQASILSVVDASQQSWEAFNNVSGKISETDQLVRQIKSPMEEQQQGSLQIGEALHSMNDNTAEVRQASAEMTEGNEQIVREVNSLQTISSIITSSVDEMTIGAQKINETGVMLSEVATEVNEAIGKISNQINKFKI